MSHREARDSDSKRHRSRLAGESSPKRTRRDGKPEPERVPGSSNLDSRIATDPERKQSRRLQDKLPLEFPSTNDAKREREVPSKELDRKPSEHDRRKHSWNQSEVSRPRSYHQHDERNYATQNGRSSRGGFNGERGWWGDSRDQHNERTGRKSGATDSWRREDRAKEEEKGNWRHDKFFETKADAPSGRKRPAFREKKVPEEENANPTSVDHPTEESRKDERALNSRRPDWSRKPFAEDGPQNRSGFLSREGYQRNGGEGNFRGRDRFAAMPGNYGGAVCAEKWKHDLYNDADKSPTPKNEEDQIAKVEALLAS